MAKFTEDGSTRAPRCASMLQKNLEGEKAADKNLNDIAERTVNRKTA